MNSMPNTEAEWNTEIETARDAGLHGTADWMTAERDRRFPSAVRWVARRSVIDARTDEDAAMGDWAADRSNWAHTAEDARTILANRMDDEAHAILGSRSFVSAQGVRAEARDHVLSLVRAAVHVRLDDLDGRQFDRQGHESGHVDVGNVRWSFYPVTVR